MIIRLAALLLLPLIACAQYGTGVLLGTVTDTSGAVVAGARVVTRNVETNEVREFTTDSSGNYQFNALPAGNYVVTVTANSFKQARVDNLVLRVNSQLRADVGLQVGTVSESIDVEATAPLIQTNTAAVGTVVDNRTVRELPFNNRNFYDLVALTPGVVKVRGASSVMDERSAEIGGVRNTSTNAMLDGVDFSVANINNPAIALSLDMIEEFKVQLNFMDASYGHGAAGIDIVSKRGTNGFHGVVYEFLRNRALQAGQFFRPPAGAPRFTFNQFGASAGGRIYKGQNLLFREL